MILLLVRLMLQQHQIITYSLTVSIGFPVFMFLLQLFYLECFLCSSLQGNSHYLWGKSLIQQNQFNCEIVILPQTELIATCSLFSVTPCEILYFGLNCVW